MASIKLMVLGVFFAAVSADYSENTGVSYGVPSSSGGDYSGGYSSGGQAGYSSVGGGGGGYSGGSADLGGGYGSHSSGGYSSGSTGGGYGHHEEHHEAKPYEFGYSVKDHHHGTDFGQEESSDGHNVKGSYRVVLPDGRTQIVTYHADWKTGFHADVKYEGEAHYPSPSSYGSGHGSGSGSSGYSYPAPHSDYTGASFGGHSSGGYSR